MGRTKPTGEVYKRICPECGEEFETTWKSKKYCNSGRNCSYAVSERNRKIKREMEATGIIRRSTKDANMVESYYEKMLKERDMWNAWQRKKRMTQDINPIDINKIGKNNAWVKRKKK